MINRVSLGQQFNQNHKAATPARKAPVRIAQNLDNFVSQNKAAKPAFGFLKSLKKVLNKITEAPKQLTPGEAFDSIVADLKKAAIRNNPLKAYVLHEKMCKVGKFTEKQARKLDELAEKLNNNNGHVVRMKGLIKDFQEEGLMPIIKK